MLKLKWWIERKEDGLRVTSSKVSREWIYLKVLKPRRVVGVGNVCSFNHSSTIVTMDRYTTTPSISGKADLGTYLASATILSTSGYISIPSFSLSYHG